VVNSSGECEEDTNNDFADGHFQTMIVEEVKLVNADRIWYVLYIKYTKLI
jgi:hypothetical protein